MAVRSRQLGPFILPAATGSLYTVPALRTLIIHTVTLYNGTAGTVNIGLAIQSGGVDYWWLRRNNMVVTTSEVIAGLAIVLNPGQIVRGFSSVNPNVWCSISGTLLAGAPA